MAPVDGGGNVSRPSSPIPVTGQTAEAPQVNVPLDDVYNIMNLFPFLDGRKAWRGNQNLNGYKMGGASNGTSPQDYVTLAQVQDLIASISILFPGFQIVDTATSVSAPQGWLYANGQEVSRAAYPTLWTRISSGNNLAPTQAAKSHGQYGPGNGTTTFTLPNLYADGGYFIRPITSGRAIGTVQADELRSHTHTGQVFPAGSHNHTYPSNALTGNGGIYGTGQTALGNYPTSTAPDHIHGLQISQTGGDETRPKNIAYPVLIKT